LTFPWDMKIGVFLFVKGTRVIVALC